MAVNKLSGNYQLMQKIGCFIGGLREYEYLFLQTADMKHLAERHRQPPGTNPKLDVARILNKLTKPVNSNGLNY